MIIRNTLIAAAGLFVVGFMAPPAAQAAPPVAADIAQGVQGTVEKAHTKRRCWWRNGRRHCRYVRHHHRWGHRYGYGPGFSLYFGPSRGIHRGHRNRGHHRRHR